MDKKFLSKVKSYIQLDEVKRMRGEGKRVCEDCGSIKGVKLAKNKKWLCPDCMKNC